LIFIDLQNVGVISAASCTLPYLHRWSTVKHKSSSNTFRSLFRSSSGNS